MSLPKPDLHLRLGDEAMTALKFLAAAEDIEISRMAARLLEDALLGVGHRLKCAAKRALLAGMNGDSRG